MLRQYFTLEEQFWQHSLDQLVNKYPLDNYIYLMYTHTSFRC